MPITKSAKKSLRVSRTKKAQNDTVEVLLAKQLKKTDANSVNQTIALIDKAAKRGIIHPNKAARMKSALSKKFATPKASVKAKTADKKSKTVKSKKPVAKK